MKSRIITLCLILVAFTGINVSYAAFPVKQESAIVTENAAPAATATETTATESSNATVTTTSGTAVKAKHMGFFHKIKAAIYPDVLPGGGRPGWPGILAFVFGILSLTAFLALPFLLFSLGAFIFGIIGVSPSYSLRLLAVIGLIIGALALLALAVA